MSVLVISNDVTPGFGVPVAAPGLRSHGIAQGLRSHGFDVLLSVPRPILDRVWPHPGPPSPPPGTHIVNPPDLMGFIDTHAPDIVVFTNANMAGHLAPREGTAFVYDLFAPKMLELLASGEENPAWIELAHKKERAFALADHVIVNGHRKLGYALGWLLRPAVHTHRVESLGLSPQVVGDPMGMLTVAEMAVDVAPEFVPLTPPIPAIDRPVRAAIAGYNQAWSVADSSVAPQTLALDAGVELHMLMPHHWGGAEGNADAKADPRVIVQEGALGFDDFCRWISSMDFVIDAFPQTAERHMAMVSRSAVALRLGIPVVHGVDSEVSDIISHHDAGWVVNPHDPASWRGAFAEAQDPQILAKKSAGARAAAQRFDPRTALAATARVFERLGARQQATEGP